MDSARRTWLRAIVALLVTVLLQGLEGYQFDVEKTECISQLVGRNGDRVYGSFVVVDKEAESVSERDDVEMKVTGPIGNLVIQMKSKGGQKFDFQAVRVGLYKICFTNPSSTSKKVDFNFHVGHSLDPKDLAKDEHFDPVAATIGQLGEALEKVVLEQQYYRARDVRHRQTNESTQNRLLWYTLMEYICLIGVSLGQVYLLQRLFSKRIGYNIV